MCSIYYDIYYVTGNMNLVSKKYQIYVIYEIFETIELFLSLLPLF